VVGSARAACSSTTPTLFAAVPPNTVHAPRRIPADSLLGLTGLLLTCSYRGKEFVRVGYYVNVEYTDPELADETKPRPNPPLLDKLQRSVMAGEAEGEG
jgi:histone chaperone ASF1